MKRCLNCKAPLPIRGELKQDTRGEYVLRVCICGRIHKTRFGVKKPVSPPVVIIYPRPPRNWFQQELWRVYVIPVKATA